MEWGVFLGFFCEFVVAAEVHAEADLDDDEGAVFLVEGARVGGGCVWDSSCIDEVWCCDISSVKEHMGLPKREDPIRYAARYRGALSVTVGGGETLVVESRVLGDVGVAPTADIF